MNGRSQLADSFLRRALNRVARVARALWDELFPSEQSMSVKRWYADGGDQALRFNYDFDRTSIILDLGGFEGQWSSDLYSRFLCKIHLFEPVRLYAEAIALRFSKNPDISVQPFGLGGKTREETISVNGAGSSIFKPSSMRETVRIVDIVDWLADNKLDRVNLMKVNIEGGEYELLERLIDAGWMERFDHLQVQFHWLSTESGAAVRKIQGRLKETHNLDFQYPFLWEGWSRKAVSQSREPVSRS